MVFMTKIGKKFNKKLTYRYFFTPQKERCSHSWLKEMPPESSSNKMFFVFVLFLGTILISLDPDLDLQTPLNLDSF